MVPRPLSMNPATPIRFKSLGCGCASGSGKQGQLQHSFEHSGDLMLRVSFCYYQINYEAIQLWHRRYHVVMALSLSNGLQGGQGQKNNTGMMRCVCHLDLEGSKRVVAVMKRVIAL